MGDNEDWVDVEVLSQGGKVTKPATPPAPDGQEYAAPRSERAHLPAVAMPGLYGPGMGPSPELKAFRREIEGVTETVREATGVMLAAIEGLRKRLDDIEAREKTAREKLGEQAKAYALDQMRVHIEEQQASTALQLHRDRQKDMQTRDTVAASPVPVYLDQIPVMTKEQWEEWMVRYTGWRRAALGTT